MKAGVAMALTALEMLIESGSLEDRECAPSHRA